METLKIKLEVNGNKPLIGEVKNSIESYQDVKNQLEPEPKPGGSKRSKNYAKMLLKDLQAIAKARKIPYSGLKKADLIAKLRTKTTQKKTKRSGKRV